MILTSTNTLLLAGKNSVIPEGVLYLESGCYGCGGWDYQITDSIEIPSSVIGIKGTVCSGGFTGPLSVKMNSTTPPVLASVSCFPANTSIQVPVGRVSSYQAAQYYDTYTVNSRPKITYHLANRIYQEDTYNSGATVVPPQNPDNSYVIFLGWNETIPTVMPDANVSITANYEIINRVRFYPSDFSVLQPHFSIKAEKAGLSLTLVSSTGDCINLGTD